MTINELLKSAGIRYGCKNNFMIKGISTNSKTVRKGFLFIAIKGSRSDGNMYINEAIKKGAKAIVHGSGFRVSANSRGGIRRAGKEKVIFVKVSDTRKAVAELAASFYEHPSNKLKVVGVTGTNGKTTVTYLIESIVKKAGYIPAVIGTINYRFKNKVIPATNTTPGPVELQSMLSEMKRLGVEYVAMEVSSHALDQNRTGGIDFSSAIFTNISQDHLDYHKTREKYVRAKSKLFSNLSREAQAIINNDDPYAARLKKLTKARVFTYGIDRKSDVMAQNIKFDVKHTEFLFSYGKNRVLIKTRLIGKYNVYNILAAAAWALASGFNLKVIKEAIEDCGVVPGRLERVDCDRGYSIFVDYAHTEDALKNVLEALRQLARGKIIVVFGCGGDRDRTKRPKMGRVVSEMADYAIITNDNPRSENPNLIAQEIQRGIRRDNYCVVLDRSAAIKKALTLSRPDDLVLLAGKGHEAYQILKDKKIHFDDKEAVRKCLRSMNS